MGARPAAALGAFVIPILGVPLGALVTALIAASISHAPRPGDEPTAVPARVFGIVSDALIGVWLAVAVLKFTPLEPYGILDIPLVVMTPLVALSVQWLRVNLSAMARQAWAVALEIVKRRFGGAP